MGTSSGDNPVVEAGLTAHREDVTLRALQQRIRQQEILSELGVMALQGATFDHLLDETARLTAEGLRAEFCKILEYLPSENRLLVRAGVGWGSDIVRIATVGADLESPSGFALRTGKPVISNHLENEKRFRTPPRVREPWPDSMCVGVHAHLCHGVVLARAWGSAGVRAASKRAARNSGCQAHLLGALRLALDAVKLERPGRVDQCGPHSGLGYLETMMSKRERVSGLQATHADHDDRVGGK